MTKRVTPTRYRCPECSSTDLRAEVSIVVTVEQPEGREPLPILEDLDLGYGFEDDDLMLCNECEHQEKAAEFLVREV